jgi:hypothetical protein
MREDENRRRAAARELVNAAGAFAQLYQARDFWSDLGASLYEAAGEILNGGFQQFGDDPEGLEAVYQRWLLDTGQENHDAAVVEEES